MSLVDDCRFFLSFFQFLGRVLLKSAIFWLYFRLAAAVFSSCDDFSRRGGCIKISISGRTELFEIVSVRLGGKAVAFGERRVVEEVGDLGTVPGFRFMVLIDFKFYVYLHKLIITA